MFWRKAEVEIVLERRVYHAGEVINARARIQAKGNLAIEEARVELRRSQRYAYQRRERDNDGHYRWSHTTDVEHTAVETVRILGAGELTDGQFFEYYLSFTLPEHAAPSGDASLLDTGWSLQLILNRRRAIDVNAGTSFQVLAPAAQSSARIATQARSSTADRCAVLPEIPCRDIQAGATIAGTIIVFARQPVEARQVRVELVRIEQTEPRSISSPTRGRNDSTTVVKQTIAAGGALPVGTPWGFPFTLTVPADAHPTAFTPRGTVRWLLRGVVDRSLAEDYSGEIEVNIYNGPATLSPSPPPNGAQVPCSSEANEPSATAVTEMSAEAPVAMSESLLLEPDATNPLNGRRFPLDQPLVTLGRRETNTIVVPEQAVSRTHAEIRRVDSAYLLRDLGSTSGTYLNGAPLTGEHALCPGDVVGLGPDVTFTVRDAIPRG